MIKITKAKETRKRDKKRNRFLITIGDESWHLTKEEIIKLRDSMALVINPNR